MLGFNSLKDYLNIFNFTTTRIGGVSKGDYASLNGSYFSGDELQNVKENWETILSYTSEKPSYTAIPYQTHGDEIRIIDQSFLSLLPDAQKNSLNGVDALITAEKGVLITVATADCVPITLYDPRKQVVAVVHSGWRGTVKNIVGKTINTMSLVFGSSVSDIIACIGPSISVKAFEVGDEVVEQFAHSGFDMESIAQFNSISQKYHIDLWKANKRLMLQVGVMSNKISCASICTYTRHKEFFSARRLGIHSGRIITGIMLKHEL